jgi:DNA-binding CsgD family transcriptional regulator
VRADQQFVKETAKTSVKPWDVLLGQVFAASFARLVAERSGDIVTRLRGGDDAGCLAGAVVTVLFGTGDIPPEWWRTPLGLAVGPHLPDAGLTQREAAAILGITYGAVGTKVRRGNLGQFGPPPKVRAGRPSVNGIGPLSRRSVLEEVAARVQGTGKGRGMPPEKLAEAKRMRNDGMSYERIGKALSVHRNTVWRALRPVPGGSQ